MLPGLDDEDGMRALDPSDVMSQLTSFPDQLEWSREMRLPDLRQVRDVVICGMGGSAIAGDVINDLLAPVCRSPIAISRHVSLPAFADRDTLAVVISYSGNTAESIDLFHDALARECQLVTVTSGGHLERLASEHHAPLLKVPGGNQPRASLGYLLGAVALTMQTVGLCRPHQDLLDASPRLRSYLKDISPKVPASRNQAKKLASALHHGVPVFYSPRHIRSVALRWQNQFNENAKAVAFSGEIPEMDHNQIVGWCEGGRGCQCRPIFLLPADMPPTVRRMTEVTLQMFNERGLDPVLVQLPGQGTVDNILQGIALGDMVSYYLAMLKGVDPAPVAPIKEFKERIGR